MKHLFFTFCILIGASTLCAKEPVKVGLISERNLWALMAINQNNGAQLAVEQINAAGGVLGGRPLEIIYRDGGSGTPADVLRDIEELVHNEGIQILTGTGPDNVGLAVSDYAKRNKIFYLKGVNGTNKHIWEQGHKYAFRFDVPNYMYGEAFADIAAKTKAKRWAFVAPNYEFGRSVVEDFQKALTRHNPNTEYIATQWFPMTKIEAGLVAQVVARSKPDGIFFAGWGSDAIQFIREGKKRGLFNDRVVIGVLTGQPEQLEFMGEEAPLGWITQGFPYNEINLPAHKKFLKTYKEKFGKTPGWFAFVGYNTILSLAAVIEKAGSTDPEVLVKAMEGLTVETTAGPITYRAADHQSNLGLWIGKTTIKDGIPTITDWEYKSGDLYYPGDDFVKTVRPQGD